MADLPSGPCSIPRTARFFSLVRFATVTGAANLNATPPVHEQHNTTIGAGIWGNLFDGDYTLEMEYDPIFERPYYQCLDITLATGTPPVPSVTPASTVYYPGPGLVLSVTGFGFIAGATAVSLTATLPGGTPTAVLCNSTSVLSQTRLTCTPASSLVGATVAVTVNVNGVNSASTTIGSVLAATTGTTEYYLPGATTEVSAGVPTWDAVPLFGMILSVAALCFGGLLNN